jgi:mRNA interferase MazF
MILYNKGDIVLVPFPFTNQSGMKKRPALVISPDTYNSTLDILIGFITSNVNVPNRIGDYHIRDWQISGLPKPSMFRMKLATLEHANVIKKLGTISTYDMKQIEQTIVNFIIA